MDVDKYIEEEETVRKEWIITPEGQVKDELFFEALETVLAPYQPSENIRESDEQFSTNELIQAIEEHYGVGQGDPDVQGITGEKVVDYLVARGFKYANTGGLKLEWLLKKKEIISMDPIGG